MINAVQHNCARLYAWTMAALETGVERKADLVILQELPEERGGIGISHSAYKIRKRKRVWTAVPKGSGLATDERTDLSRATNNDVIVTDVKRGAEKTTRIINLPDQRDLRTGEGHGRKMNWGRIIRQRCGTILAGNFNAHIRRWDLRCKE